MAEQQRISKDLQEVLKEMSKAPGGNVAQPRPVTPGPILGGPPVEPKPGVVDPATGVRSRRDPAIELFRFYAYGEEKPSRIPEPKPNTKKVTVTDMGLSPEEVAKRQKLKEKGFRNTKEKREIQKAVREGTVGGMTREPGSKPPVHLAKNLPIAIEMAAERARRRTDAEVIRAALEKAFGVVGSETPEFQGRYTPELNRTAPISREEQKYLDYLQRRIQDVVLDREAMMKEELAARGQTTPTFKEVKATQEAERRTLEGRQAAERTRLSRQKTEMSFRNLPDVQELQTPTAITQLPSEKIIIHSGGAVGADTEWASAGKKAGAEVIAHSFQGHKISGGIPLVHSKTELKKADNLLSIVQKEYLPHKTFTNAKEYTKDLLRRNYFQIKDSQALIAAGKIEDVPNVGRRVSGGTSWAFYMAVNEDKPAYIFNQSDKKWYKGVGKELVEIEPKTIPRYTVIAGVGSRDLDESGRRAINDYVNNRVAKPTTTGSKLPILGGKTLGVLSAVGTGLEAFFAYKIMLAQAAAEKKQLQSNIN